ncbi:MAG TPA: GxxExxY protein [Chitinophagaceae bacterium]|jgi:GxxExxY protein|nr:GxxExxY protein [Chitinophagaceae bacterium]
MIKDEYKHSAITEKIIGCAMRVHQRMRNGYPELIYHKCLIIEFKKINLPFLNEIELPIFYDDIAVGKRRIDFLIDNKVIVEIKALSELTDSHLAQALNYLEVMNLEIGLLINFGSKSLEVRRLINNKCKPSFKSDKSR